MTITTNRSVTEPALTELDAPHLQITQSWTSGESRTIHVEYNADLDVMLLKGTGRARRQRLHLDRGRWLRRHRSLDPRKPTVSVPPPLVSGWAVRCAAGLR